MPAVYETPIDAVGFDASGWGQLPSGKWVPLLPPIDVANRELFAILDYDSTLSFATKNGVRIISPATVVELNQHGTRIDPVILPDAAQRAANPRLPGEPHTAYEQRLRVDMSSLEWVRRHAAAVWLELDAVNWDRTTPVSNVGKHWVDGAVAGKSKLLGWSKSKTSSKLGAQDFSDWHQPLQNAHNRLHKDYSSIPMFECDEEPTWLSSALAPLLHSAATATAPSEAAVLKALSELGTQEQTGHNDGVQIAKFFSGATRIINGVERRTGWMSGWDWCAAFFGWCGHPTWRIAVREYYDDARAANTWRAAQSGYQPKRGDGVVLARGGKDPTKGQEGHICRVELPPDQNGSYVTIGGNELNSVKRTTRSLDDAELRGFIEA